MHKLSKVAVLILAVAFAYSLCSCKTETDADNPAFYSVTIASGMANGSVSASPATATAGTEITLTVTPDTGYQLGVLTAMDADGKTVTVTGSKFTMPESNVTVSATFTKTVATLNQEAADAVAAKITGIGTVAYTDGSKAKIDAARAAYNALTDTQKALVTNYEVLAAAETKYAELKAAAEQQNPSATTYTVAIASGIANGTVTASPTTAAEGTDITLTAEPASGYTFGSYSVTDADGAAVTVTDNKFTMPESNVTVTATFTALPPDTATYTVKHLQQNVADDNYTLKESETKTGKVGEATSANAKSYEGFTAQTVTQVTIAENGTVVEIKYDRNTYTVTFSANGGSDVSSQTMRYGATAVRPSAPAKEGYDFAGWLNGESEFDFETAVTENITLTAKWTPVTYTITYVLPSGVTIQNRVTAYTIESETITLPNLTRAGYTFIGWYDAANGGNKVESIPQGSTGAKTFYARWTLITYTITYVLPEGVENPNKVNSYTVETETFPLQAVSREGYTFTGWYDAESGGNKVESIAKGSSGEKKLYAQWKMPGSISYATTAVEKTVVDGAFSNELTIEGDGTVTYASSKPEVAAVDANGLVTITGAGETTITATVEDGEDYTYETKTASYTIIAYIGTKAPGEAKAVGDIVFNDGSATPYSAELTLTDKQKEAAIALIFYKGTGLNSGDDTTTSRTLGVGLKHNRSGLAWCLKSADAYSKNIATIQCPASGNAGGLTFTGDRDGSDNLEQVETFDGVDDTATEANYPAFYFAKNYSTTATNLGEDYADGWYLPSIAELFQIYANGKGTSKVFDIDAASNLCGGDSFRYNGYWSSSQYASFDSYAYFLTFYFGDWTGWYKYDADGNYVCAVRAFN